MIETIKKEVKAKILVGIFLVLTIWWLINNLVIGNQNIRYDNFIDFGGLYGLVALLGGIWGIRIAVKWGGLKSVIGRAILMFSLGLLAQEFGQLAYALHNDLYKIPGPYPSLGDIGFFGSIPLYIYGILLLAKSSGAKIGLKSVAHTIQAVLIPLGMLLVGYFLFLQGYEFDWSDPLRVFLDFGYPMGQAIYVSLAFMTYLLSRKVLGGVMKGRIIFILFALCVQFLSDYVFLYQSYRGTWSVGGINDYMYLVSYFLMALALLQLGTVLKRLKTSGGK